MTLYRDFAINDMAEVYRSAAMSMVAGEPEINGIITMVQSNTDKYDPNSVFPIVATARFMESLPDQAQQCNECEYTLRI